jgi:hypothetical protein
MIGWLSINDQLKQRANQGATFGPQPGLATGPADGWLCKAQQGINVPSRSIANQVIVDARQQRREKSDKTLVRRSGVESAAGGWDRRQPVREFAIDTAMFLRRHR